MAFENRREILFVYSAKDANPNGDPLNSNYPRYDDDSGQILVSDVRIKRTVRDQWIRENRDVFVDGETKTLKQRIEELQKKLEVKSGKDALAKCIDTRVFGVTFAHGGESFAWTGPVQFKWGRSLHRATVSTIQGTAAFAAGENKDQRSFRNEYIVPFVLIADYAIANQYASRTTGATDDDLNSLFEALWLGTENLITRSKVGHEPRLLMEIRYCKDFDGIVGSLDEKIAVEGPQGNKLSADQQLSLRSCEQLSLNLSGLNSALERVKTDIETVKLRCDTSLKVNGLDVLKNLLGEKLQLEER
jgi:CRISPR-associated protein Csh2